MKKGQTVIVIDTDNYKSSYSEKTPFKAKLCLITEQFDYLVKSLDTGKKYELSDFQILEALSNEEIFNLLKKP